MKIGDETHKLLLEFLADPLSKESLTKPFDPFSSAFADRKSQFDKRTSAINVTPNGGTGSYDIKVVKDDSLWLAKEAKIDEVSALRLVVLEHQARSKEQLLSTSDDGSHNGDEVGLAKSSFFKEVTSPAQNDASTASDVRRKILLQLYIKEKLSVLRTTDALTRHYGDSKRLKANDKSRLFEIARATCVASFSTELDSQDETGCLSTFISAIKSRFEQLEHGLTWSISDELKESIESHWQRGQIDEIIVILQLLVYTAQKVTPTSEATVAYFTLLSERKFLYFEGVSNVEMLLDMTNRVIDNRFCRKIGVDPYLG